MKEVQLRVAVTMRLPAPRMRMHNLSLRTLMDVGEEVG